MQSTKTRHAGRQPIVVERYLGGRVRQLLFEASADTRGSLVAFDFDGMPFEPRRSFVIHSVPADTARGGHAHAHAQQLMVCLAGIVAVELRHAGHVAHVQLASPCNALLVAAGVWAQQRYSGPEAILLVMASHPYDPDSYVIDPP
jgi:UDP-2-acetamido-3-amino-2,3-dideoxy-glucuronate N-acetyltransferase